MVLKRQSLTLILLSSSYSEQPFPRARCSTSRPPSAANMHRIFFPQTTTLPTAAHPDCSVCHSAGIFIPRATALPRPLQKPQTAFTSGSSAGIPRVPLHLPSFLPVSSEVPAPVCADHGKVELISAVHQADNVCPALGREEGERWFRGGGGGRRRPWCRRMNWGWLTEK